jgi:hypothetical protein
MPVCNYLLQWYILLPDILWNVLLEFLKEDKEFLPILAMDWFGLLRKAQKLEGKFGVLAPFSSCSKNFLQSVRNLNKPFFLDRDVFEDKDFPWYQKNYAIEVKSNYWIHEKGLKKKHELINEIQDFFDECDGISPDYVLAPDAFGDPLVSLYLARLSWSEYIRKTRNFELIGVVQVGHTLYNWNNDYKIPQKDTFPPHYRTAKSFLAPLISEYHNIGYQYVALGGLLKNDSTMPTGLKFGLSDKDLDDLLSWSRPNLVLGGLALTRLEVLKKHNVWADSTNWLWWDGRYDYERFGHRNVLQEVVA